MAKKKGEITERRSADANHDVITVVGGSSGYRRRPCSGCPWKRENDGDFPAEAFRHSASTAYDASDREFACHESPDKESPLTCAGFLLRNADHNLATRIRAARGQYDPSQMIEDPLDDLHENYRDMAIANGVDPDDPVLIPCRD